MADSIATIEANIEAQIAADPNIGQLDANPSNIAIFKVFRHAIAFVYNLFQRQQDDYETRLTALVNGKQIGNPTWWQDQMLAFQYGDSLLFINNVFQYATVDATKQVIQLVSVVSGRGIVTLKCASLVGGVPQPLTTLQVQAAQAYALEERPCGIDPVVQSYPADLMKYHANIYYDPQVNLSALQALVYAAINNYLNSISTVNFDGTFYLNQSVDAIQAIPGVIKDQVLITNVAAKSSLVGYANIVSDYPTIAGYIQIDPAFALSATLTFIPAT